MTQKKAVTCFILEAGKVLLQRRPADRAWGGMVNGPGGKCEPGESPIQAVIREVSEETGLNIINPQHRGALTLHIPTPVSLELTVEMFVVHEFEGTPTEREGALLWVEIESLPFEQMWEDQKYWLPAVLDGFSVSGEVNYEPETLSLRRSQISLLKRD